jgi:hypothetical protein
MHNIEPYDNWREYYVATEDENSPYYGEEFSEFEFRNRIYNYLIHPAWDEFGSSTLYGKVLFVNYESRGAVIELIGEWNDCLHNDIMHFKRNLIDPMLEAGINQFILICENVLNFHASDDCYYEEWREEVEEEGGWIVMLNTREHMLEELQENQIASQVHVGEHFNKVKWRTIKPHHLLLQVDQLLFRRLSA